MADETTAQDQDDSALREAQRLIESESTDAGLTDEIAMQTIREHGFENPSRVHMAVLEVDGTISIMPIEARTVRTRHRVRAVKPGEGKPGSKAGEMGSRRLSSITRRGRPLRLPTQYLTSRATWERSD